MIRSIVGAVTATAAAAAASLAVAPVAAADWTPATQIGPGGPPMLAIAPYGTAALAFQDSAGATYLARRPAYGQFSAPIQVATPGSAAPKLAGLVLPAGGATVLLFDNFDGSVAAQVQPSEATAFGPPQQLVAPAEPDLLAGSATLLGTTDGAVIAGTVDDRGDAGAKLLARGATTFGDTGVSGLSECGVSAPTADLAADDAGGAFAALGEACQHVQVFYRRAGSTFGPGRQVGLRTTLQGLGLGAGGPGDAAVAEVYGGFRPGHVMIQVGRGGHFGPAHALATTPYVANTYLYGPAVGPSGNVTVGWEECGARQIGCSVGAARGNVDGRFGRSYTLGSSPRNFHVGISARFGAGVVALQHCRSGRCSISIVLAGPHDSFGAPRRLTADGQSDQLVTDPRGDQLIVWSAGTGSLWAATRSAGAGRFSLPHELSPASVDGRTVAAQFGSQGEAVVAWAAADGSSTAAVYQATTTASAAPPRRPRPT